MGLFTTKNRLILIFLFLLTPSIIHAAAIKGLEEGSAVGFCKQIDYVGGALTLTKSGLNCTLTSSDDPWTGNNSETITNDVDEVIEFKNNTSSLTLDVGLESTGNDNVQLGVAVGSATSSGYVSIMEDADLGNANRSPSGTSANPVLRVYSSDETQANDYIEMFHDQSNAIIKSPNTIILDSGFGGFTYRANSVTMAEYRLNIGSGYFHLSVSDNAGNAITIANQTNVTVDTDHALQTNPTLFIQSDLSPDISNNQWGSLHHDQEDFIITTGANTGTGTGATTDENSIEFWPRGTLAVEIDGDGGLIPKLVTADPCGTMKTGSIFYNSTSNYPCFCDGAGIDVKMSDNITACF